MKDLDVVDREIQMNFSSFYGFPVPITFAKIIRTFRTYPGIDKSSFNKVLELYFDLVRLEGYDARYPETPPEIFPIGRTKT